MDGFAVEILLVEDSVTDLELTLRALEKANVTNQIEVARDGAEALERHNLGVNSYIVQPVEFDGFMAAVTELGLDWMLLNRPPPPVA